MRIFTYAHAKHYKHQSDFFLFQNAGIYTNARCVAACTKKPLLIVLLEDIKECESKMFFK